MKSVCYCMCLLLILTYVFAIAFTQLSVDTPNLGPVYFANVGLAMYSLIIYATFLDDLSNMMDDMRNDKWPLVFIALVFICLASMTLMNMLIGVLCEVVDQVAAEEKDDMMQENTRERMSAIAKNLDTNFNGKISYEEFQKILDNKVALQVMEEVGVNPAGIVEFSEMFFFDEDGAKELGFEEFMDMMLDLRQDNKANTKDVLDLWRRIKESSCNDIDDIEKLTTNFQNMIEDRFSQMTKTTTELMNLTDSLKSRL